MKKSPKIIHIIIEAFENLNLKITPWRRSNFIRNFIKNLQKSGWFASAEKFIKKDYQFLFENHDKIFYDRFFDAYCWAIQKYGISITNIEKSLKNTIQKYKKSI